MNNNKLFIVIGILFLITILLSATMLSACTPKQSTAPTTTEPAKVYKWKYQANADANNPQTLGAVEWVKQIKELSGGRLDIEVFPVGQLVKGTDALDAMREQTIDGAETSPGYYTGFMPEGAVMTGFPMIIRTESDMDTVYFDKGILPLAREAFAEHGAYLMGPWGYGGVFLWAKKPLKNVADFKGVKIRVYGDMSKTIESLGAAVTYIPHSESYMALQLGTVEGYSTSITLWESMKHYEICKYIMTPAVIGMGISTISLSQKSLDQLPIDLKLLVKGSAPWAGRIYTYKNSVMENKIMANPGKYKGEIVPMSAEVIKIMTDSGVGFLDTYISKGGRVGKMAQIMKDYVKEMGYVQ